MHEINNGRTFMGRVPHDADLLEWLTGFAREKNIQLGEITLIGAVKKAVLAFYHQDRREYALVTVDKHMEILHGVGNISLKEGEPFVHMHLVLGDEQGRAFGSHLAPGTVVFACEAIIREFTGGQYLRKLDKTTGLTLWAGK